MRAPATSHCTHSLGRADLGRGDRDTHARCCSVTLSDCFPLGMLVCVCDDINVCVCQGLDTVCYMCARV